MLTDKDKSDLRQLVGKAIFLPDGADRSRIRQTKLDAENVAVVLEPWLEDRDRKQAADFLARATSVISEHELVDGLDNPEDNAYRSALATALTAISEAFTA